MAKDLVLREAGLRQLTCIVRQRKLRWKSSGQVHPPVSLVSASPPTR